MQLLIKQRVFSWTDTYDVYDEHESPKYFVKAEFFALGHQIHVYDKSGKEVGMVKSAAVCGFARVLISKSEEKRPEVFRKNFPFSSRAMSWITTDGGVREIFWRGNMMSMRRAVWRSIFQKSRFNGAIPM